MLDRDAETTTVANERPLREARVHLAQVHLLVERERRTATAFRKRRALDRLSTVLQHVITAVLLLAGEGGVLMRARNIKPGFFQNEELAVLLPITRLLFAGLWCLADREGRLEDRARRIRAEVFPYEHGDSLDIHRELTALEQAGFVRRHTVRGLRLIDIPNFKKHQSPHHTERASRLPGWDERDQPQDIDTNEFTALNKNL
jgi:hypothetical protein